MTTWAIADLHGHLEVWKKVKEIIGPDDEIYVLGDCVDRGPQSWETFKTVYNDPQSRVLKGNHEDMMVNAIRDYLIDDYMWDYQSYSLCIHNGGRQTLEDWEIDPDRIDWFKRLRDLPTWDTYCANNREIVLCHAGFTPWMEEGGTNYEVPCDEDLIWDREHYLTTKYLPAYMDDVMIVHGHTPIIYVADEVGEEWESGAFWYMDGHKCCIDSGGFFSDEFVLLNLDTLEDIVITLDKKS